MAIENPHNRSGGRVFPQRDVEVIAEAAHARAVHLDGARIWNASVATGCPPATLCEPVDSVSACFSKGLGAPVGSVLAGDTDFITRAHRSEGVWISLGATLPRRGLRPLQRS